MGTGHVMRCLALAQAWQDSGGEVIFAMAQVMPAIEERLSSERAEVVRLGVSPASADDAEKLVQLTHSCSSTSVVVDGYHFDSEYQRYLKEAGLKLLVVDDTAHVDRYHADLILNQNPYATKDLYPDCGPNTRLLLGPNFALLRREFVPRREWRREIVPKGNKILVTLGGSDPANVTARVIRALASTVLDELEIIVVVGGGNPHEELLQQVVSSVRCRITLQKNVSEMPRLMEWADLAISGAGSTCWEMCLLALPAIIIPIAENQVVASEWLSKQGVARVIESSQQDFEEKLSTLVIKLLNASQARATMSAEGAKLIDGQGASRVARAILNTSVGGMSNVCLA
jgi:UDP-2,4-diacetamido-2,4,6-trideoxy-beta-L-altropyranose hydrolase